MYNTAKLYDEHSTQKRHIICAHVSHYIIKIMFIAQNFFNHTHVNCHAILSLTNYSNSKSNVGKKKLKTLSEAIATNFVFLLLKPNAFDFYLLVYGSTHSVKYQFKSSIHNILCDKQKCNFINIDIISISFQLARRPLESDHGDPFTLLNAYDEWIHVSCRNFTILTSCKR